MTVRYASVSGSNTSPYDTLAKGATDLQTVIDLSVAGDTIRAYGTFQPSSVPTLAASGDTTSGFIKLIGVNASDVNDGTRFKIDANENSLTNCIDWNSKSLWYLENADLWKASGSGLDSSSSCYKNILNNCVIHECASGINGYRFSDLLLFRCAIYENTGSGIYSANLNHRYIFSSFTSNGLVGIKPEYCNGGLAFGCIIADNATDGIEGGTNSFTVLCCAIDGNATGWDMGSGSFWYGLAIANRITKNNYGINFKSLQQLSFLNYFEDNTTANYQNDSLAMKLGLQDGTPLDAEDTPDTDEGYASAYSAGNLRSDYGLSTGTYARGSRLGITIPMS